LIVGSQKQAAAILQHFGSLAVLGRASVEELLPFVSRSKALRLVSSLRMGAVALREERQRVLTTSNRKPPLRTDAFWGWRFWREFH